MRVLAKVDPEHPETCSRPSAKDRTGLVLREGAVLYLFESETHARARGARLHARVAGYVASSDAADISAPDALGQAKALQACLRDAQLSPADVGCINADGTATPPGDPVEVASIRQVFGAQADLAPVSSTQSLHGHLIGAAGAIELLAAVVALQDGILAPTANLHQPAPGCDLNVVPLVAWQGGVRAVLSTSFAFGGSNACIARTRA